MQVWQIILATGIPSGLFGLLIWYFQRRMTKAEKVREEQMAAAEKAREEQQKNLESLVLMMLQSTRANSILCKATAEAVRDGHCNGNMTAAMEAVAKAAEAEKQFLLEKGIKYIFE